MKTSWCVIRHILCIVIHLRVIICPWRMSERGWDGIWWHLRASYGVSCQRNCVCSQFDTKKRRLSRLNGFCWMAHSRIAVANVQLLCECLRLLFAAGFRLQLWGFCLSIVLLFVVCRSWKYFNWHTVLSIYLEYGALHVPRRRCSCILGNRCYS